MRIAKTSYKVIFLVGAWLIGYVITNLVVGRLISHSATIIVGTLLVMLQIAIAVRIFRGPNEDMIRPRAWWRATSRPPAGFVVGGISAGGALVNLLQLFQSHDLLPQVISTISAAAVAIFFLHSSIKLTNTSSLNEGPSNVGRPIS